MPKKDKPIRKEEKISETWLLPYADMLTLLLALFSVKVPLPSSSSPAPRIDPPVWVTPTLAASRVTLPVV